MHAERLLVFNLQTPVFFVCFKLLPCGTIKVFVGLFCRVASLHAFRYTMEDRDPVVAKGERGAPLFAHVCVILQYSKHELIWNVIFWNLKKVLVSLPMFLLFEVILIWWICFRWTSFHQCNVPLGKGCLKEDPFRCLIPECLRIPKRSPWEGRLNCTSLVEETSQKEFRFQVDTKFGLFTQGHP